MLAGIARQILTLVVPTLIAAPTVPGLAPWLRGVRAPPGTLVALAQGPVPQPQRVVFPAGTIVPIRFLGALTGGRDPVGTPVVVQSMGALVHDGCIVVGPYAQLRGRILASRGSGRGGRPGLLGLAFDSLQVGREGWLPLEAVLDSLEYAAPGALSQAGELAGGARPGRGRYTRAGALTGVAALTGVGAAPVALLEGWRLSRRGPKARILAGEVARLRLTRALAVVHPGTCVPAAANPDLTGIPALPRFQPRTHDDPAGLRAGDPINLLFLGSAAQIDGAFGRAGWVRAQAPSVRSLARGVTAALVERSAVGAPVSTQYFEGRKQDLAYELSGPNARIRHHLRIWLLDDTTRTWVAAADQDVGLVVKPLHGTATHRIAPEIDEERDRIVRELEATGCATLLAYLELPGALRGGRNASGQAFVTDGRAGVIRLSPCP